MKIGLVTVDESIAEVVAHVADGVKHSLLRRTSISNCIRDQADMIFVQWEPGPSFSQVLQDISSFSVAATPVPIVAIVPDGSIILYDRARGAGAFDAIFYPPLESDIRAEIEEVASPTESFDPGERRRFEEYRGKALVGEAPEFLKCLMSARQAARSDFNVLLLGETGTGKNQIAGLIHHLSVRSAEPFEHRNCAAIPVDLLESELFGSMPGAFAGAMNRAGAFELVRGGTLFLDEIGDMREDHQVKILHVVERGEFRRLGATTTTKFRGRLIFATNKNLDEEASKGHFRGELKMRISQLAFTLPKLNERRSDIPQLAWHFLRKYTPGRRLELSDSALKVLQEREYPFNVRDLENVLIKSISACGKCPTILPRHLPQPAPQLAQESKAAATIDLAKYSEARDHAGLEVDQLYLPQLFDSYRTLRGVEEATGVERHILRNRWKIAFPERPFPWPSRRPAGGAPA